MKGRQVGYSLYEEVFIEVRADLPRRELHAEFQRVFDRPEVTVEHIKALCTRRGWGTGRTGRFEKGQVPPNKGKKTGLHPGSVAMQFKKGNRPHTWRGAGHERVCPKDGYVILIVDEPNPWTGAPTRPVLKHRWLWEKQNGPVPEGMRLKCLDGDKLNCDPSNWEPVPMGLAPRLNGIHGRGYDQAPPEIKPTILALAKLEHRVQEIRKEQGLRRPRRGSQPA